MVQLRILAILLAAVACAALPASAGAFTPPSRALYGGGAIGPTFNRGNHSDVTWVSTRVAKDVKSVTYYADVDITCGAFRGVVLSSAPVPLKKSGAFSGSYTIDPAANNGIAGTLAFTGRFTGRGLASGTLRTSATRNGAPCTARKIKWQMRLPSRTPRRPKDRTGGSYYGSSDQTFPVLLRTNRSRRTLRQASLEFDYGCQMSNAQRAYSNETTPGAPISKTGRFHATEKYSSPMPGGLTAHWSSDLTGRFAGNRATGIWNVDVQITRDADGTVVDNCTSGPTRFAAME